MITINSQAFEAKKYNLIQVFESDLILLDVKYAGTDNFMQKVLYKTSDVYLHSDAYNLLMEATKRLEKYNKENGTNYKLKIWDGFRPYSTQIEMYNLVKNTPQHIYVSSPEKGEATHTRGIAIDLTLVDDNNKELDMGTEFDNFTPKAHRDAFEKKLITKIQEKNRQLLNEIMGKDFIGYWAEWWHYNLPMTDKNKIKYPKIKEL